NVDSPRHRSLGGSSPSGGHQDRSAISAGPLWRASAPCKETLHLLFQLRDLLLQSGRLGRLHQRRLLPIGAVELVQIMCHARGRKSEVQPPTAKKDSVALMRLDNVERK